MPRVEDVPVDAVVAGVVAGGREVEVDRDRRATSGIAGSALASPRGLRGATSRRQRDVVRARAARARAGAASRRSRGPGPSRSRASRSGAEPRASGRPEASRQPTRTRRGPAPEAAPAAAARALAPRSDELLQASRARGDRRVGRERRSLSHAPDEVSDTGLERVGKRDLARARLRSVAQHHPVARLHDRPVRLVPVEAERQGPRRLGDGGEPDAALDPVRAARPSGVDEPQGHVRRGVGVERDVPQVLVRRGPEVGEASASACGIASGSISSPETVGDRRMWKERAARGATVGNRRRYAAERVPPLRDHGEAAGPSPRTTSTSRSPRRRRSRRRGTRAASRTARGARRRSAASSERQRASRRASRRRARRAAPPAPSSPRRPWYGAASIPCCSSEVAAARPRVRLRARRRPPRPSSPRRGGTARGTGRCPGARGGRRRPDAERPQRRGHGAARGAGTAESGAPGRSGAAAPRGARIQIAASRRSRATKSGSYGPADGQRPLVALRGDEHGGRPGALARDHVALAVADRVRPREVDPVVGGGAQPHPRGGLAVLVVARATAPRCPRGGTGSVGRAASRTPSAASASSRRALDELVLRAVYFPRAIPDWFVHTTSTNPAPASAPQRVGDARRAAHPRGVAEVAGVVDQRPVAVEEHRAARRRGADAAHRDGAERLRAGPRSALDRGGRAAALEERQRGPPGRRAPRRTSRPTTPLSSQSSPLTSTSGATSADEAPRACPRRTRRRGPRRRAPRAPRRGPRRRFTGRPAPFRRRTLASALRPTTSTSPCARACAR